MTSSSGFKKGMVEGKDYLTFTAGKRLATLLQKLCKSCVLQLCVRMNCIEGDLENVISNDRLFIEPKYD